MKKVVIVFFEGSSAKERKDLIREEMLKVNCSEIIEGYLMKKGYDPIEYGYGDSDLVFAEQIEVHYEVD